jgi:hypothetical protein
VASRANKVILVFDPEATDTRRYPASYWYASVDGIADAAAATPLEAVILVAESLARQLQGGDQ